MTARHALAALEREGMVVRRRGAATFVAPPKIDFNKLMSYTEQMSCQRKGRALWAWSLPVGPARALDPQIPLRQVSPV